MAAIFNLNGRASYLHWHFFTMSLSNVVLILVMLALFGVAIWVRLPQHDDKEDSR